MAEKPAEVSPPTGRGPTGSRVRKKVALTPLRFWLLAVVIGLVGGCGAVVFRGMIAFFHNAFFLGKISFFYEANVHTPPGPWGPFIILVPVIGAVGVTWLVQTFAPEARGHGVPEVMDAIYYNKSIIRPVVAVIKSVASALSIGSGGSVGREGPINAALQAVRRPRQETTVAEISSQGYAVITADTSVFKILTKMSSDGTEVFLLAPDQCDNSADGMQRWISKESIAESLIDAVELFAD